MPRQYPEPIHDEEEEDREENVKNKKKRNERDQQDGTIDFPFHKLLSNADAFDWTLMGLGTLGSIVHGMAQPIGYLLLGKALNAFGNNIDDTHAMVKALLKVVPYVWYMAIATFPAGILEIGCWMYTSERQVSRLRLQFLRAALSQEIGAFDTDLTTAKVITGVSNHMSIIQDAIGEKLGHFMASMATFFSGVLIAFICCWEVSLLALFVVPMILAIGATYTKTMNTISAAKMSFLAHSTSIVEETISQIKTVCAFVGEISAIKSFSNCLERQLSLSKKEAFSKGIGTGLFQMVTFCSWALIVWVGAIVVVSNRATGGDVIAAVMSILFGAISLTYAAPDMQVFNQAKAAGFEVFQVIIRKPLLIIHEKKGKTPTNLRGDIDIHDVHFIYPSRPEKTILQGFSLSIPAGKVVAFVGSSGCGKSTILSLLLRLYDPSKGKIRIDNVDIKDFDLKFLRKNIGIVFQEPSLFSGSIKDNMKVGNVDADEETIIKVAKMANAHSFISEFPNNYSTDVGQRGLQLSGGQKQRIAIARAVLKDPPILLLDEATSALDSESEKLVQDALETAMRGRTVVLIAHRLSTIINADMIAVVENGQVTTTGTHRNLLECSPFYNNLFNMQNITVENNSSNPKEVFTRDQETHDSFDPEGDHEQIYKQEHTRDSFLEEEESTRNGKTKIFFRIWFGLKKREFVKLCFGSLAAAFSGISKPVFGYYIITIGVAYYHHDAKNRVGVFAVMFSCIGLLSLFSHSLQHYIFGVIGEKAMTNLRQSLYSSILRNELAWFEKPENSVGSLTSRVMNDTVLVKTVIADRMSVIVQCVSSILIATAVSMYVNWRMGLVAWAVMPCHFIGGLIQAKSAKGFSGDLAASHSTMVAIASEATTNIKTVVSFCYEDRVLEKAKTALDGPMRKCRIESVKYGVIQGVSLLLWNVAHAVALWYTAILVDRKQASFENGIRSYQIFSLTVPSITELWTLIPTVVSAISVLTPAFQTLDRRTEIEPDKPDEGTECEFIKGEIEFVNVHFNYPLRPEVNILNGFSLEIAKGTRVALIGPSGAGKSSVLALILRFYDPREGSIKIDGKNIREYNLRKLRKQIGLVQQEPLLFSFSIRENICYGNEAVSETEIMEAAKEANIHEFVCNLADGYDTLVGQKGCQLSGGQKQRIAIARTLLKKPSIMLLDEATSALDPESERMVMSALESTTLSTRITVAHRLSTVVKSDAIVVMNNGLVVEMGTHSSLVEATDGLYSKFYRLQSFTNE